MLLNTGTKEDFQNIKPENGLSQKYNFLRHTYIVQGPFTGDGNKNLLMTTTSKNK